MSKKPIKVIVEGTTFNSIKEAANYIDSSRGVYVQLAHALARNCERKYKGLSIAYADEELENQVKQKLLTKSLPHKYSKIGCPVLCKTTGKRFKSITKAAKHANVNDWTMSKKMETAGKFMDKHNNEYIRLVPMNTKNVYANTGATLKHEGRKTSRTVNPTVVKEEPNVSSVELAKTILKNKTVDFINGNRFDMAKEFIDIIEKLN